DTPLHSAFANFRDDPVGSGVQEDRFAHSGHRRAGGFMTLESGAKSCKTFLITKFKRRPLTSTAKEQLRAVSNSRLPKFPVTYSCGQPSVRSVSLSHCS